MEKRETQLVSMRMSIPLVEFLGDEPVYFSSMSNDLCEELLVFADRSIKTEKFHPKCRAYSIMHSLHLPATGGNLTINEEKFLDSVFAGIPVFRYLNVRYDYSSDSNHDQVRDVCDSVYSAIEKFVPLKREERVQTITELIDYLDGPGFLRRFSKRYDQSLKNYSLKLKEELKREPVQDITKFFIGKHVSKII